MAQVIHDSGLPAPEGLVLVHVGCHLVDVGLVHLVEGVGVGVVQRRQVVIGPPGVPERADHAVGDRVAVGVVIDPRTGLGPAIGAVIDEVVAAGVEGVRDAVPVRQVADLEAAVEARHRFAGQPVDPVQALPLVHRAVNDGLVGEEVGRARVGAVAHVLERAVGRVGEGGVAPGNVIRRPVDVGRRVHEERNGVGGGGRRQCQRQGREPGHRE